MENLNEYINEVLRLAGAPVLESEEPLAMMKGDTEIVKPSQSSGWEEVKTSDLPKEEKTKSKSVDVPEFKYDDGSKKEDSEEVEESAPHKEMSKEEHIKFHKEHPEHKDPKLKKKVNESASPKDYGNTYEDGYEAGQEYWIHGYGINDFKGVSDEFIEGFNDGYDKAQGEDESDELEEGFKDNVKKALGIAGLAGTLLLGAHASNLEKQHYIDSLNKGMNFGDVPEIADVIGDGTDMIYITVDGYELPFDEYWEIRKECSEENTNHYYQNHQAKNIIDYDKEVDQELKAKAEQEAKKKDNNLKESESDESDDYDEFDDYDTCVWCGQPMPKSDMRKEKDMGYICHHCARGLESREGKLDWEDEELDEDTVKTGSQWTNKGSEGTHGKFKTKKEADAQRKAMFANGYKG